MTFRLDLVFRATRIQTQDLSLKYKNDSQSIGPPILFLLHINDLPSIVSSKVRLFADDCLIYRQIKSNNDQIELQRDLNLLESWGA